jgi:hypothetical protein
VAMSESLTNKDINDSLHLEGTEHAWNALPGSNLKVLRSNVQTVDVVC